MIHLGEPYIQKTREESGAAEGSLQLGRAICSKSQTHVTLLHVHHCLERGNSERRAQQRHRCRNIHSRTNKDAASTHLQTPHVRTCNDAHMSQATPSDPYPKTSPPSMSQDREKKMSFLRTNKVEITTAFVILVLGVGLGVGLPDQSMPHRFNRIITVMLKDVASSIG